MDGSVRSLYLKTYSSEDGQYITPPMLNDADVAFGDGRLNSSLGVARDKLLALAQDKNGVESPGAIVFK